MFAYEIIGYVLESECYCLDCAPAGLCNGEDVTPVFAGDEDSEDMTCDFCYERLHDGI
jgi:hypothetical protein